MTDCGESCEDWLLAGSPSPGLWSSLLTRTVALQGPTCSILKAFIWLIWLISHMISQEVLPPKWEVGHLLPWKIAGSGPCLVLDSLCALMREGLNLWTGNPGLSMVMRELSLEYQRV